jgi:hypothetical protein
VPDAVETPGFWVVQKKGRQGGGRIIQIRGNGFLKYGEPGAIPCPDAGAALKVAATLRERLGKHGSSFQLHTEKWVRRQVEEGKFKLPEVTHA